MALRKTENKLLVMKELLKKVLHTPVEAYDPAGVMAVVNMLIPLGKEKALEEITAALPANTLDAVGAFWILRVLFELPPEEFYPTVKIGRPDVPPPEASDIMPRFPIVIIRDIPFLAVKSYDLSGVPERVEGHINYFRQFGIIRHLELSPPKQSSGIEAEFLAVWESAYGEEYLREGTSTFKEQLNKLF
jgi:hypothetical protein